MKQSLSPLTVKYSVSAISCAFLVIMAGGIFLRGLFLMLLFGVLHGWVSASVPTVGFWHSTVIALLLACLFSVRMNYNKD